LTRTAPCPQAHGPDRRRDERSQRHCPAPETPGNGTDYTQLNNIGTPTAPVTSATSSGARAGHLKDASGAATRPGLSPVLDPPGPFATDMSAARKQERPVPHAHHPAKTRQTTR